MILTSTTFVEMIFTDKDEHLRMNKTKYLAQKQLDIEERELFTVKFVTTTGLIATLTVVNLQHLRILSKISIYFM